MQFYYLLVFYTLLFRIHRIRMIPFIVHRKSEKQYKHTPNNTIEKYVWQQMKF